MYKLHQIFAVMLTGHDPSLGPSGNPGAEPDAPARTGRRFDGDMPENFGHSREGWLQPWTNGPF